MLKWPTEIMNLSWCWDVKSPLLSLDLLTSGLLPTRVHWGKWVYNTAPRCKLESLAHLWWVALGGSCLVE